MSQEFYDDISRDDIGDVIVRYSAINVLLVTGRNSFESSGAMNLLPNDLGGVNFHRFFDFAVNPKIEDVERGLSMFLEKDCDMILAIGGGSAIDMAKCINIFQAHQAEDFKELVVNNSVKNDGVPLIAIPTTAGTGSEATHFAVIYMEGKKYSLAHPKVLPQIAGLNYRLTLSQPQYVTACAALDALSQAIESFWSVNSTKESQDYASNAISMLLPNLQGSILGNSVECRRKLSKGSYLAGRAINITKTTAAHAMSYAFTTHYSIPHGHAVFLTLPQFLKYNSKVVEEDNNDVRGVDYVRSTISSLCKLLGEDSPNDASQMLEDLAASIEVELSLEKLGINRCHEVILNNVNLERMQNNPRKVPPYAIRGIIDRE